MVNEKEKSSNKMLGNVAQCNMKQKYLVTFYTEDKQ